MKQNNLTKWFKNNILPVLFIIGGIIAETTDLIVQLLNDLNAPLWIGTIFKIIVMTFAAFRLYYSIPKYKRNLNNYKKLKQEENE